ncbi:MAG: hypothetical protein ACVCEJ_09445 [Candidatus Izemoplasmataceae bacterium]
MKDDQEKNKEEQQEQNDHEKTEEQDDQQEQKEEKKVPDLDIEELMKELQKLEEVKKQQGGKKSKMPKMITIEFGGVFHPNLIVNTVFYFILNLAIMSILFEVLSFAVYQDSIFIIMFVAAYTLLEMMFRIYMMTHHLRLVFKTFGLIFYIGYLFIFYILDSFVFDRYLYFLNETLLVVFVAIFALIRYVISFYIRQNFRKRNLR